MSGRPLPLVLCSADGRFSLGEEALAVLAGLSGPVGVVAVAGRARQGKSFVLNQLVAAAAGGGGLSGGRHAPPAAPGFVVASTHRPCTKGIWLWSEPVARTAADGSRRVASRRAAPACPLLPLRWPLVPHARAATTSCCWTPRASTRMTRRVRCPCVARCVSGTALFLLAPPAAAWTSAARVDPLLVLAADASASPSPASQVNTRRRFSRSLCSCRLCSFITT